MFGELRIVPSGDVSTVPSRLTESTAYDAFRSLDSGIQVIATHPVEAAIYNWKWYYSAPGFAIWIVLILSLALPKPNHDRRVLLIFIPILCVNLLWTAFSTVSGMPSGSTVQFYTLVQSMAVGTAVLWLICGYLEGFSGMIRLLLAFGIVLLVATTGILSYSAEFPNETGLFLVLFLFLTLNFLAAIAITGAICRIKWSPKRFMLWLALWMLLVSMFTTLGFRIAGELVMSTNPSMPQLSEILAMIFIVGPILGLGLYLLNLPFMILGFVNPFFRERLISCLALQHSEKIRTLSDVKSANGS